MKLNTIAKIITLTAMLPFVTPLPADAQTWPTKPVRWVLPSAAASPMDIICRIVGERLSAKWGQPVLMDNRPGANHSIGTNVVAKSTPDGYTLLTVSVPHVTNPSLSTLPYTSADFAPVTMLTFAPVGVVAAPNAPFSSVAELIAQAKAKPGFFKYGSTGSNTTPNLASVLFQSQTGIKFLHIPYTAIGQARTAVASGEIDVLFDSASDSIQMIEAKRVKGIAITSSERSPVAPNLPTVKESGVPDYTFGFWTAVLMRAGTAADIVDKVNRDINAVLQEPEVRKVLIASVFEPKGTSPQELGRFIDSEQARWAKIIKENNIRPD